jgi:hypothetical protein
MVSMRRVVAGVLFGVSLAAAGCGGSKEPTPKLNQTGVSFKQLPPPGNPGGGIGKSKAKANAGAKAD